MTQSFNSGEPTPQNQGGEQPQGPSFGANEPEPTPQVPRGDEGGDKVSKEEFEKLVKRLNDSQDFIEQLKSETKTYREQIEELQGKVVNSPSVDEILEKLQDRKGGFDQIDPDEIVQRATQAFEQSMTAKQKAEQEQKNFESVSSVLSRQFGKEVDQKVAELAEENGMSFDEIVNMAKRSPKATLKLLGVKEEPERGTPAPSRGSVNSLGLPSTPQAPRKTNIAKLSTDKDRVAYFQTEMAERLKKYTNPQ